MRSDIRALVVSILLFLLWGTGLTYPFRAISDLISNGTEAVVGKLSLPAIASAVFILLVVMGITCVGLLGSKMEISEHLALGLSFLGSILYSVKVFTSRSFSTFVLSKKNNTTKKIGKCVVFRNYAASKGKRNTEKNYENR